MVERERKEGISVAFIEREIEQEFDKYGFVPFKIEEIAMGNIEESVLQIVANWLYRMGNNIVCYVRKEVEKENCNTSRNIGKGISAVFSQTFADQCTIKGKGGVEIGIEYKYDDSSGMGGCHEPSQEVKITIIGKAGAAKEIFFAEYLWDDSVDPESVRISTSSEAKKAFQLLQEKHRKILRGQNSEYFT